MDGWGKWSIADEINTKDCRAPGCWSGFIVVAGSNHVSGFRLGNHGELYAGERFNCCTIAMSSEDVLFLNDDPGLPEPDIQSPACMNIREATEADFDEIWPVFKEVVSTGDTCAYPQETSRDDALKVWIHDPLKTFIIEENSRILGTYYLKTSHAGPGSHVCSCEYMVSPQARGRGLAATMCEHSQNMALELGYKAMQFDFIPSTNVVAVGLWNELGFEVVGRLPGAFKHPAKGYVAALVMFKWLE
jgi:ribosomal protein S18 acetylase RimI-like enzyme